MLGEKILVEQGKGGLLLVFDTEKIFPAKADTGGRPPYRSPKRQGTGTIRFGNGRARNIAERRGHCHHLKRQRDVQWHENPPIPGKTLYFRGWVGGKEGSALPLA